MDTSKIVAQFKESSAAGLSFEAAKEKLVSQGYTEAAINLATDTYQYGSKPTSDVPDRVTEYFEQHPEQANADADQLLAAKRQEDAKDAHMQAGLDLAASEAGPDLQSQVSYGYKYSQDVGISYWLFLVLGLVVNGIAYVIVTVLHINKWLYAVNGALSIILLVYLIKRIK